MYNANFINFKLNFRNTVGGKKKENRNRINGFLVPVERQPNIKRSAEKMKYRLLQLTTQYTSRFSRITMQSITCNDWRSRRWLKVNTICTHWTRDCHWPKQWVGKRQKKRRNNGSRAMFEMHTGVRLVWIHRLFIIRPAYAIHITTTESEKMNAAVEFQVLHHCRFFPWYFGVYARLLFVLFSCFHRSWREEERERMMIHFKKCSINEASVNGSPSSNGRLHSFCAIFCFSLFFFKCQPRR